MANWRSDRETVHFQHLRTIKIGRVFVVGVRRRIAHSSTCLDSSRGGGGKTYRAMLGGGDALNVL